MRFNQHEVMSAYKRFKYFKYFIKGFRVIDMLPIVKYWGINKMIVIDENDNYHILEPNTNHLSLTKEESLKPKRYLRNVWDGSRWKPTYFETMEK